MTPGHAFLREGFALADSLSLDPHKWLFAPFDTGALLVRDPQALRDAYTEAAEYTAVTEIEPLEAHAFFDHGLELSPRLRALKLWMMFKLRGVHTYRLATRSEEQKAELQSLMTIPNAVLYLNKKNNIK